jgi:hypothetical protein
MSSHLPSVPSKSERSPAGKNAGASHPSPFGAAVIALGVVFLALVMSVVAQRRSYDFLIAYLAAGVGVVAGVVVTRRRAGARQDRVRKAEGAERRPLPRGGA